MKEEDSTEDVIDQAMDKGLRILLIDMILTITPIALRCNPYVIWPIVYHATFTEAVDHLEQMAESLSSIPPGGPLEALQFFHGE